MLDHNTCALLGWVCGGRDQATGQKLIENYEGEIKQIYADHYPAYPEIAGAIPLKQTKQKTYQLEQNNGYQRHWLACFHRKSRVVTRSIDMLHARLKLFSRYRINGDITELTACLRKKNYVIKPNLS